MIYSAAKRFADNDPIIHLAATVLLDALQHAGKGDREDLLWLLSKQGELYMDAIGINPEACRRWVKMNNQLKRDSE